MKSLFAIILSTLLSQPLFAKDSTWLLCKGSAQLFEEDHALVVNVFEHRAGMDRATEFTLIFGGHSLDGTLLDSANTTQVALTGKANGKTYATYKGVAEVDFQRNTLTLKGTLDLYEKTAVDTVLDCETLSN